MKKRPHEIIVTEGTLDPYVYFVKRGTLNVVRTSGRKVEVLTELGVGDFIAEMAHLGKNKVHSASVMATSEVELIQIEADKIYEVLAANPVWLKAMLNNLVKKIEAANAKTGLT
ncbi:MAG: cyclic nucleotide-binding domain-containing protein [Bdellovibrio sp.]|nr:cyclic nucleotide-binding domain-containing protein [Bdellovibrio sp.]